MGKQYIASGAFAIWGLFGFMFSASAYEFRLSDVERWSDGSTQYVVRDVHGKVLARGVLRVEKWTKHSSGKAFPVATVRDSRGRFITDPQEGIVTREDHYYVNSKNRDCVNQMAIVRGLDGKFIASLKLNDQPVCW